MIRWFANFQIPNSGTQSQWVYAIVEDKNIVGLYTDSEKQNLIIKKEIFIPDNIEPYDYLLSLEEFSKYEKY